MALRRLAKAVSAHKLHNVMYGLLTLCSTSDLSQIYFSSKQHLLRCLVLAEERKYRSLLIAIGIIS
jgi:hypothetical protein